MCPCGRKKPAQKAWVLYNGGMTGFAQGATVGVLMLDTQFPRIHGDIGNERTWDFPVRFKRVKGAPPDQVVYQQGAGTLPLFISAAQELVREGADGISTGCGFLALFQDELAAAVSVPVATSSIMQVPLIERMLAPDKRVGIVTISAQSLTSCALRESRSGERHPHRHDRGQARIHAGDFARRTQP